MSRQAVRGLPESLRREGDEQAAVVIRRAARVAKVVFTAVSRVLRLSRRVTHTCGALSREDCRKCKRVTLHKRAKCVHCGTEAKHERTTPESWRNKDFSTLRGAAAVARHEAKRRRKLGGGEERLSAPKDV